MTRQGDWIETYTGRQFWPVDPRPEDVDIRDIAHALSLLCRYNGQCRFLYTVGQHSLCCADIGRDYYRDKKLELYALLHDASEAYISDVSKPVKPFLTGYKDMERRIMAVVYAALGVEPPNDVYHRMVKRIDQGVMVAEAKLLMPFNGWGAWTGDALEVNVEIGKADPDEVEARFLARFRELTEG